MGVIRVSGRGKTIALSVSDADTTGAPSNGDAATGLYALAEALLILNALLATAEYGAKVVEVDDSVGVMVQQYVPVEGMSGAGKLMGTGPLLYIFTPAPGASHDDYGLFVVTADIHGFIGARL